MNSNLNCVANIYLTVRNYTPAVEDEEENEDSLS